MIGNTRFVVVLSCGLLLWTGIAGAVDIDARGSRMDIVNNDTIILRGVYVGPQTYWGELRWDPSLNIFALTGYYGLEGWNTHPPLPSAGYWSASAVWNNKLYVIGGADRYDAIEAYDPGSRTWDIRRHQFVGFLLRAVTVGNLIYVLGGSSFESARFWKYDPSRDVWTSLPTPPTPGWVSELAEVGGKIYVFGGIRSGAPGAVNEVWEYDTGSAAWTSKASLPTARYASSTAVMNGKIYVFGGNYGSRAAEVYDPTENSWQILSPLPFTAYGWDVAAPAGDRIVVVEAERGESVVYDPATNSWQPGEPILTQRGGYVTGEALLGSVYVAGGSDGRAADRLESYNPAVRSAAGSQLARALDSEPSNNGGLHSADREHRHLAIEAALLQTRYEQVR